MSKVAPRGQPKLCRVSVSSSRVELSKAMGSVRPGVHERAEGNGFRGNAGKDIKGMSRDDIREVGDYGNAVPDIRSLIGRSINGRRGMRKSRGRVRM